MNERTNERPLAVHGMRDKIRVQRDAAQLVSSLGRSAKILFPTRGRPEVPVALQASDVYDAVKSPARSIIDSIVSMAVWLLRAVTTASPI